MPALNKDISIIKHILDYCVDIEETVTRFGNDYAIFSTDKAYRNACALCILQIGELVGHLSDDFKHAHHDIPWSNIKAMRNIVAHAYGSIRMETTWETIQDDIPYLKNYCQNIIDQA